MNKVLLTGRLTREIELKKSNDTTFCNFGLAVDKHDKDKSVDFIECTSFGKTAGLMDTYLSKGDMIGVTGRLSVSRYKGEDGTMKSKTSVIVEMLDFLSKAKQEATEEPQEEKTFTPTLNVSSDDLPF